MDVLVLLGSARPEDEIPVHPTAQKRSLEDHQVINDTITKYGLPQNHTALGLPGPELATGRDTLSISDELVRRSGAYTLKVRTITRGFSYNARYEDTKLITR
ncbi:uncharacterized protein LOC135130416 [Zophobas morio]|uniref:uncharacterized protein LOC135130416 n=1 Tax=Zophobas morio TaxID=2755281 RepID=UPI003082CBA1